MNWHNIILGLVVAFFALSFLWGLAIIGKPRKPFTGGDMAANAVLFSLIIWAVVWLAGGWS